MFQRALVRPPASNFASGLTTVDLGVPNFEKALDQHERYCEALVQCSLALTRLSPDPGHPDSTFVEDTAVLTKTGAILTHPGAPSRVGEVAGVEAALRPFFSNFARIAAPGTVDGGDICEAGDHYFIGISARTNAEGARQLALLLAEAGATSAQVDVRGVEGILHLKSGIAALSERRLVVIDALAGHQAFRGYEILRVPDAETYAANCVRVNDTVLVADGFPGVERAIRGLGQRVVALDMSEFQKMDGGLSCLSLRWGQAPRA